MRPSSHPSDEQLDAATWCRHLIPDGSVYAFLADHRHQLFPPELFADLVVQGRSHPPVPAQLVATVMVLQALEGLSDREAISALRRDIAWKVACGLRLDDEGFYPTVLVYWRIRASSRPRRIFEAVRQVSARWWSRPGRSRVGVGGCWTPPSSPSWRTRSPPRTPSRSWSRRSAGRREGLGAISGKGSACRSCCVSSSGRDLRPRAGRRSRDLGLPAELVGGQ
jgi:hypothetical protein